MFSTAYKEKQKDGVAQGGIKENLLMTSVKVEKTSNNKEYLLFLYQGENGALWQKEFKPNTTKQSWQTDEQFKNAPRDQMAKIYANAIIPFIGYEDGVLLDDEKIAERYAAIADGLQQGASFTQIAEWFNAKIMPIAAKTPLRVKIVYDKMGYTQLPNYLSKSKAVEPMSVKESGIWKEKNDNFENVEKEVDTETPSNNPYAGSGIQMPADIATGTAGAGLPY